MCGGDNGASERARVEASRQSEAERQRLAEEAAAAKAEAERRYLAEQARQDAILAQSRADAEAMRKDLEDRAAATLAAQQKIEDQRKAERDADLARQEKQRSDDIAAALAQRKADQDAAQKQRDDELARQEGLRKAAEDKAVANAATLGKYSTDRQSLIDNARTSVASAFDPYNDDFYNKYASDYSAYYKPQIQQQYDDAKRATTFNFADRGSLNSTAAARAFGRLDQTRAAAEGEVAQKAASAAAGFRGTVDSQRSSLLNGIFSAASAAPPITVDSIGQANDSLRSLTTQLTAPVSLAASAASAIKPPVFSTLTNPFGVVNNGAGALRATTGGTGSNGAYSGSGGSSGRLVN